MHPPHNAKTTFAKGINPFQGLGALPTTNPAQTMQTPAKPAKTRLKDEYYSTDYKPPALQPIAHQPTTTTPMKHAKVDHVDTSKIEICSDPLPESRALPGSKYEAVFKGLKMGQSLKCQPDDVGKVSAALRKWIELNHLQGNVRSMKDYGDGMGRVWMLALPAKALKVAA